MWLTLLRLFIGAIHRLLHPVRARIFAWTRPAARGQILGTLTDLARSKPELVAENAPY